MLFENLSPVLAEVIRRKIEITIQAYEPRVELNDVIVLPKYNQNAMDVSITFTIINAPREPQTVELLLERLR